MYHGRPRTKIGEREPGLVLDGLLAPLREHEVGLDPGGAERFEQAHAEDRTSRAGDAYDDALRIDDLFSSDAAGTDIVRVAPSRSISIFKST
jgi:hypothetical protein